MGYPPAQPAARTHDKAIASLVVGVVAFLVPIPFVLGIVAIVLGNAARREIRGNPRLEGDGLAIAGIVLGWVDVALSSLLILIFLFFFGLIGMASVAGG